MKAMLLKVPDISKVFVTTGNTDILHESNVTEGKMVMVMGTAGCNRRYAVVSSTGGKEKDAWLHTYHLECMCCKCAAMATLCHPPVACRSPDQ